MPATAPRLNVAAEADLVALGATVRKRRQELGRSMAETATAAGISRVTLHRIERGNPSVTAGAYANAVAELGLRVAANPGGIRIGDYAQLSLIAWNHRPNDVLTDAEVLDLYERNWRHVDLSALSADEGALIEGLARAAGHEGRLLV